MLSPINIPSLNGGMRASSRLQNLSELFNGSNDFSTNSIKNNSSKSSEPAQIPEENINQAIANEKEQLLLFQLMRAIAQQNQEQPDQAPSFTSDLEFSFSFSQTTTTSLSAQFSNEGSSGNAVSAFFGLEFTETTEANFNFSIDQETGEFSLSFSFTQSRSLSAFASVESEAKQVDPLIVNLSEEDFKFDLSHEVSFDLDASGTLNQFYAPSQNNFFLALDKNANGKIDNGLELFGDAGEFDDGFKALQAFDLNSDSVINSEDQIFSQLSLLSFDRFGGQRLIALNKTQVTEISLSALYATQTYQDNNKLIATSDVKSNSTNIGQVGDFLITVR